MLSEFSRHSCVTFLPSGRYRCVITGNRTRPAAELSSLLSTCLVLCLLLCRNGLGTDRLPVPEGFIGPHRLFHGSFHRRPSVAVCGEESGHDPGLSDPVHKPVSVLVREVVPLLHCRCTGFDLLNEAGTFLIRPCLCVLLHLRHEGGVLLLDRL